MFRDFFLLERVLDIGRKIIPWPVFDFFQPWYHGILALSGAVLFGFPSWKVKVIGVTGSKGKSTTVFLISKFLEEAGYKVAAIGSLGYKIGDRKWPNNLKMTMPGRWKIQKFLSQAVKAGCQFVVLEVTSEGIKQKRHWGIKFDAAVFTNLEKEHIESHGSFKKYYHAKQELFRRAKNLHILNADSLYCDLFSKFPVKKIFYGINKTSDFKAIALKSENNNGIEFKLNSLKFQSHLIGEFNLYNILAAIATVRSYRVGFQKIKKALNEIKSIPGRMEFIEAGQSFKVVVDYAHTPGSLEAVYRALKEKLNSSPTKPGTSTQISGRLICVLGAAGGGRDRWKRPIFGRLAENYCDRIILTDEDPYDENPEAIIKEIESGITTAIPQYFRKPAEGAEPSTNNYELGNFYKILDRKEAIKKAMTLADKNDIIVITGKGSENSMAVKGGRKIPWSDKGIVLEILK